MRRGLCISYTMVPGTEAERVQQYRKMADAAQPENTTCFKQTAIQKTRIGAAAVLLCLFWREKRPVERRRTNCKDVTRHYL